MAQIRFIESHPYFSKLAIYKDGTLDVQASSEHFLSALKAFRIKTQTSKDDIGNALDQIFDKANGKPIASDILVTQAVLLLNPEFDPNVHKDLESRVKEYIAARVFTNKDMRMGKPYFSQRKLGICKADDLED